MKYITLLPWSYEPPEHPDKHRRFEPGDKVTIPNIAKFPSGMDVEWLLNKQAIKKVGE